MMREMEPVIGPARPERLLNTARTVDLRLPAPEIRREADKAFVEVLGGMFAQCGIDDVSFVLMTNRWTEVASLQLLFTCALQAF